MTGGMERRVFGAWLAAMAGVLALPSTGYALFDGLPLSVPPEFVALAVLMPFAVSAGLRRDALALLGRAPVGMRRAILIAPAPLLAVKLALWATAVPFGFEGCYRSLESPPRVGPCELSYEHPSGRGGRTRADAAIDFGGSGPGGGVGETNWNLSALNDTKFNTARAMASNEYRLRAPLAARWKARIRVERGERLRITYVGAGMVRVGAAATRLTADYARPATLVWRPPPGEHPFVLEYRFAEPPGARAAPGGRPYAEIHVDRVTGAGAQPLMAVGPSAPAAAAARIVDAVLGGLLIFLVAALAVALRDSWGMLGLVAAMAVALALPDWGAYTPVAAAVALVVVLGLILLRQPSRPGLFGYVALLLVSGARVLPDVSSWGYVLYRSAGDDWLTYESQARSILEQRSLEGGEAVFYTQAAFRYVVVLQHLLLGDGDGAHTILALTAMGLGAFVLALAAGSSRLDLSARLQIGVVLAAVLGLIATDPVKGAAMSGLSEHPTWIVLPFVIAVIVARPRRGALWILAAAAVGLMVALRTNQALGAVVLLAALVAAAPPPRARLAAAMVVAAGVLVAMIPAHNLFYGHSLVLAPTSGHESANVVLPWHDFPQLFTDAKVRGQLGYQLDAMLFLPSRALENRLIFPMYWALLAMWLATVGWVLVKRVRLTVAGWLVLALPLAYLLPYLSYAVDTYYPRHITIAYLAMGYATIAILAGRLRRSPTQTRLRLRPRGAVQAGSSPALGAGGG